MLDEGVKSMAVPDKVDSICHLFIQRRGGWGMGWESGGNGGYLKLVMQYLQTKRFVPAAQNAYKAQTTG